MIKGRQKKIKYIPKIYAYAKDREINLEDFNIMIEPYKVKVEKIWKESEFDEMINLLKPRDVLILFAKEDIFIPSQLKGFLTINRLFVFEKLRIIDLYTKYDSSIPQDKLMMYTLFNSFEYLNYINPPLIITEERLKFLYAILTKEEYEKLKTNSVRESIKDEDYSYITDNGLEKSLNKI